MTEQDKAYCGDGLAAMIIGEIKPVSTWGGYNVNSIYLSNSTMAKAYCKLKDLEYVKMHDHKRGTIYEAMLYDIFKKDGYEKAKEFFIKTIVEPNGC